MGIFWQRIIWFCQFDLTKRVLLVISDKWAFHQLGVEPKVPLVAGSGCPCVQLRFNELPVSRLLENPGPPAAT